MRHFHLEVDIDFNKKVINGSNTLTLESIKDNVNVVDLDIFKMDVFGVQDANKKDLQFEVRDARNMSDILGDQLRIHLNRPLHRGEKFNITVFYSTTSKTTSLSWMTPEQTASKTLPYLFSQCEPAYCRSIAPL